MFHKKPKNKELIKRTMTYSFMTISVITIVAVLIMIMMGYRFDRDDGGLSQGGLVQFATKPNSSEVIIDGSLFGSRTTTKSTLTAGEHEIIMRKDGYRDWLKLIDIAPGSVTWLDYARMIPNKIEPVSLKTYPLLSGALASPEGKWLAMKELAETPEFIVADLQRDVPTYETLVLPVTSYTAPSEGQTQRFDMVKWDESERYVLISHTYDSSKLEWIVLDRENPDRSRSITKLLGIQADQVEFASNNGELFYIRYAKEIRRANLDAATISGPLVTGVDSFSLSSYDRKIITYVSQTDEKTGSRSVGYYKDGDDKPNVIKTYENAANKTLRISVGRYFNATYIAIVNDTTVEILKGDLPTQNSISTLKIVDTMLLAGITNQLSFEGEGRFIFAKAGAQYVTYDLEQDEMYTTTLATDVTNPRIEWLDNHMVWSDFDTKLHFYEFDGGNQQVINSVASGYDATLSPNGRFLYSFDKTNNGQLSLQQVRLILN